MHCGHRVGLTPPRWQSKLAGEKFYLIQRECWDFYQPLVGHLQPDIWISNGDAIDGKARASGGTELIQADRKDQVEMAVECIELSGAENVVMTYGTPYHTGRSDDWEGMVASRLRDRGYSATVSGQEWISVNGTTFDIKHKVGASSIPHGRSTPQKKERLDNLIWSADKGEQPRADIILRSHVHYFDFTGNAEYLAMTLPALQGQGSKFGARQCSGIVDFGLVWFDCYDDGSYTWSRDILRALSQKQEARIL